MIQKFTDGNVLYAKDLNSIIEECSSRQTHIGAPSIHMSFDDVQSVVTALAAGTLSSAWDNEFMAMLKDYHEQYGFVFSLYLQEKPSSVTTKYQSELGPASTWLKWSLHSLNGGNYSSASLDQGKNDWNDMVDIVLKLTGTPNAIDRIPRLHQFYGSKDALEGMQAAKYGAIGFLSTDDTRNAYYLQSEQLTFLYEGENDHITDYTNGLIFYRTDLRLDWFKNAGFTYNAAAGMSNHDPQDAADIKGELEYRLTNALYANTWNCYVIFTHQWQPIAAIKAALQSIGEFAMKKHIAFDFPQNKLVYPTSKDIH